MDEHKLRTMEIINDIPPIAFPVWEASGFFKYVPFSIAFSACLFFVYCPVELQWLIVRTFIMLLLTGICCLFGFRGNIDCIWDSFSHGIFAFIALFMMYHIFTFPYSDEYDFNKMGYAIHSALERYSNDMGWDALVQLPPQDFITVLSTPSFNAEGEGVGPWLDQSALDYSGGKFFIETTEKPFFYHVQLKFAYSYQNITFNPVVAFLRGGFKIVSF